MTNLKIFQKFLIFLIDTTASFFIFQVVALILSPLNFLPVLPGYWAVWAIYYIISYCFFRKSLGQSFFGAGIEIGQSKIPGAVRIILRESLTTFPAIIFWITCCEPIVPLLSLSALAICIIILVFRSKLFGIKVSRLDSRLTFRPCGIYAALILVGVLARVINISYTADKDVLSMAPFNAEPRPSVKSVQNYVDFIKENRQDINDYIMGLFKEYDHVILCERMHPEMTQYDMIYNLVTDERFVDSVGVVFTEIGDVESRKTYKDFVNISFENDTLMEKSLASFLMDNQTVWLIWTPTNWFDFLKKMYRFNHGNEKKVEILFSDRNWLDRSQLNFRDSIMADNIISTIDSDSIKKSLIIMNFRHAFLTRGNVGYYVNRKFQGKVANVMINSPIVMKLMMPVQNGQWDVAMEQVSPIEYAFDFKGSPFGDDSFDYFPLSSRPGIKYKDMFTGIIFYKSNNEQYISNGFKYISEPENLKRIEERSLLLPKEAQNPYIFSGDGIFVQNGFDIYGGITRLANIVFIGVIIFSLLLDGLMSLYISHKRKMYNYNN